MLSLGSEALDAAQLLGKDGSVPPGRTRLSIVTTRFLGTTQEAQFWVTHLLMEIERWLLAQPTDAPAGLRGAVLLDDADLYLPADTEPPSKPQAMGMLRRQDGVAMFLASQSPADLDYRGRDYVGTWFVGRLQQRAALGQLLAQGLSEDETLSAQAIGEFHMVHGAQTTRLRARRNAVTLPQLGEQDLIALAARGRLT